MTYSNVSASQNTIKFQGKVGAQEVRRACSSLYQVISGKGFQDVILDFSSAYPILESFMIPFLPVLLNYKFNKVDYELVLPKEQSAKAIFHNANWSNIIDPERYEESTYDGNLHVPAIRFQTADQQHLAVDRILEVILTSLSDLNRGQLKALEWSLTEITDNVLNHAESKIGGIVQATTWQNSNSVEFVVADAGMGIPKSLNVYPQEDALRQAIQQGVTKNSTTNQGNGLFGSYQVSVLSKGEFEIGSENAFLYAKGGDVLKTDNVPIPYKGTYVRCVIDCNKQDLLEKALVFEGTPHDPPFDFIERKYEGTRTDDLAISIKENSNLLGSRESGAILRNKITNLLAVVDEGSKVKIDFSDIYVISSSVADEAFGKLFADIGPLQFMNSIELQNVDSTVRMLIDRAIQQRMSNQFAGPMKDQE